VILSGRRLLVTGVITKDSLAFHVAAEAQAQGAEVLLTSFGRVKRMTERAAQRLPEPVDVAPALAQGLGERRQVRR
jgi:enoyl ACP reductase